MRSIGFALGITAAILLTAPFAEACGRRHRGHGQESGCGNCGAAYVPSGCSSCGQATYYPSTFGPAPGQLSGYPAPAAFTPAAPATGSTAPAAMPPKN